MRLSDQLNGILSEITQENFNLSSDRVGFLNFQFQNIESFTNLYYALADNDSKDIFVKLLKYNMASALSGTKNIQDKFALFSDSQWNQYIEQAKNVHHVANDYVLDRIETFILDGYSYKDICRVNQGDYVFDCGSFTGNTCLYFSEKAGKPGKVYAFEAHPETFSTLDSNIKLNNVCLINKAISDNNDKIRFSKNATPGSRITNDKDYCEVDATTIDDFIAENNIPKCDFIKMDIEGAELRGLEGCKNTIKRFKPKLAICIYHKIEDFKYIPEKILEICSGYKFYLKHNSNNFWETVLFATYDEDKNGYLNNSFNEDVYNIKNIWNTFNNIYHIQ